MKKAIHNTRNRRPHLAAAAFAAFAAIVIAVAPSAHAGRVVVTEHPSTSIRVWLDGSWDVYPSYDDVVVSVRAARDCYATVFVVDTEGFLHVIHPYSPYDNGWMEGGVTYRYLGDEIGLGGLTGRGIAYVFAVGSPHPFNYTPYGDGIFIGRFGYRILGDPFVAFFRFYASLLPAACDYWDFIGIGYAHFYVRQWVRYPGYLCHRHHGISVHVHAGDYCRLCYRVYDAYRVHFDDPYQVIRPRSDYKTVDDDRTGVKPTARAYREKAAERYKVNRSRQARSQPGESARIVSSKRSNRAKALEVTSKQSTRVLIRTDKLANPAVKKTSRADQRQLVASNKSDSRNGNVKNTELKKSTKSYKTARAGASKATVETKSSNKTKASNGTRASNKTRASGRSAPGKNR